jgi:hypothetical protein
MRTGEQWRIYFKPKYDLQKLLQENPLLKAWLDAHKAKNTLYDFPKFIAWRQKNGYPGEPDGWIRDCLSGNTQTLADHAILIKRWVESTDLAGNKHSARERYAKTMKGFYLQNMIRLPPIKVANNLSGDEELEMAMTAGIYIDMLTRVLTHPGLSLRDRTLMLCQFQGGLDNSTTAKMFNYQVLPQLTTHFGADDWTRWKITPDTQVRIDLVRSKTGVRFYTYLYHDAIMLLQEYLTVRSAAFGRPTIHQPRRPSALPLSDPVFLTKYGDPVSPQYISTLWKKAGMKAGVNVPTGAGKGIRYLFHSHETRDTKKTLARRVRADVVAVDFTLGHEIDKDGYDKSPWDDETYFREENAKLAAHLNILTGSSKTKEREFRDEIEKDYLGKMSAMDERLRRMQEVIERAGIRMD